MSFSERDLQNKLDEMEAEIHQQQANNTQNSAPSSFPQLEINPSPQVKSWIDTSKKWFNSLPKFGKVAVAVGGVWLGFSVLGAVFTVVSSILSIAAIGLVLYIGYRLFSTQSNSD